MSAPGSAPRPEEPSPIPPAAWLVHGGARAAAARHFGLPADAWLDLSTGISPWAYPVADLPAACWQQLPDAARVHTLRQVAAAAYGAPGPECVLPVAGTQAAIQWLPRIVTPAQEIALLAPTYRGHADAWAAAGHRVHAVANLEALPAACGTLIIVNPNNPDGRIVPAEQILALAERRSVIVDEAFADVEPAISVTRWCTRARLIVLRSVGKFFGLAGARLGFVIAEPALLARIEAAQGPWSVGGPAIEVGIKALADSAWITQTRAALAIQARRLDALLAAVELPIAGGTDLFRLVAHPQAAALFDHLARSGILVRPFAERPHWLRFGLPGDDAAFARLETALHHWRATGRPCPAPDRQQPAPSMRR